MIYYLILLCLLGYSNCDVDPLIVGGVKAKIEDFPYAMALYVVCNMVAVDSSSSMFYCGASVLNRWVSLTAAHCLCDCHFNTSIYSVSAGSAKLRNGFISTIKALFIHKKYTDFFYGYDIALMRLTTQMTFSDKIKAVTVMPKPPYHGKALIAGWGDIQEKPVKKSDYLYVIAEYVVTSEDCRILLANVRKRGFCAQAKSEEFYTAKGDSGSALVVRGKIQIGIVSYRWKDMMQNLAIYTNVSYFYKWIKRHTKRLTKLNFFSNTSFY